MHLLLDLGALLEILLFLVGLEIPLEGRVVQN